MDSSLSQSIQQPLEFLIYTSSILIIITGVFLVKLLVDMSNLVKSVDDFVQATKVELEPTIKEIKETLGNINNISSALNKQINSVSDNVRKGVSSLTGVFAKLSNQAKYLSEIIKNKFK